MAYRLISQETFLQRRL